MYAVRFTRGKKWGKPFIKCFVAPPRAQPTAKRKVKRRHISRVISQTVMNWAVQRSRKLQSMLLALYKFYLTMDIKLQA